jgi:hypothetical protein
MKFEEKNARKYKVKKKEELKWGYIYFLMQGDEVVYVGQTCAGISRPLSHHDKEYDSFYMKRCSKNILDKREREMILKYKPKYNNGYNNDDKVISRYSLMKELAKKGINIRVSFLEREFERLGIEQIKFKHNKSIFAKDKDRIIEHLEQNKDTLKQEQEKAKQFMFYDNKHEDICFCVYCIDFLNEEILACVSIKDMYYLGLLSEDFISQRKIEFERKK